MAGKVFLAKASQCSIHSFIQQSFWNIFVEPGFVLGTRNKAMNKTKLSVLINGYTGQCVSSQEDEALVLPSPLSN